ncbi:MAG TPA: hypothetical protein DGT21_02530 [Armatimonadetes bacterium]|nr:hypothetical protein [Armatimonadota bacterium]
MSYFAEPFGGATLNAAINVYVEGQLQTAEGEEEGLFNGPQRVSGPAGKYIIGDRDPLVVKYGTSIPTGSGLGTSATLNVVWLALVRREEVTTREDKMHLAELAYETEKTLGIIGGKQDQYASAVGGINLFEFTSEGVTGEPVNIAPDRLAELESLMLLCYTGKARLSSNIHRNVWGNFRAGNQTTLNALFSLRQSAYEARDAMEQWDLQRLADIISAQRHYMRDLDASTSNEQIEQLFDLTAPDVLGGKPTGAGGGGCILFIARDQQAKENCRDRLEAQHLHVLNVAFDFEGVVVTRQ